MPLHHATLIVVRDRGLLIEGPSGSGKTTLAAALLREAAARGWFARLVADDQVVLQSASPSGLVGSVPATIAGLWELPPLGPQRIFHEARAVIDLVVSLEDPDSLPRMVEPRASIVCGMAVQAVRLPRRQAATLVPVVLQLLFGGKTPSF